MSRVFEKIVSGKPGEKRFFLGNEAIARGALESGIDVYTFYPGTPSSDVGEIFMEIFRDAGMKWTETSINEKVALEVAGSAYARGAKSMCGMKNVGLNVASDPFFALATTKPKNENSAMVVLVADDPEQHSSAVEMDSRHFLKLLKVPALEPGNTQECLDFTKEAFRISKELKIPVILRTVTNVAHARGGVVLGEIQKSEIQEKFDLSKEVNVASRLYFLELKNDQIFNRMHKALEISENTPLNFIENDANENKYQFGIITSGVSFSYVNEALEFLDFTAPILKIGMINPLPEQKIAHFLKKFKQILIVEENDPYLETQILGIAQKHKIEVKIYGKDPFSYTKDDALLPQVGELDPTKVVLAISKITKITPKIDLQKILDIKYDVMKRKPVLCPGCPHMTTGFSLKKAVKRIKNKTGKEIYFFQDIGCYTLLAFPPLGFANVKYCMGSSIALAQGVAQTSDSLNIAIIGDGTFFHSGLPPLINAVYQKAPILLLLLDNGWIGMTGQQCDAGTITDHYSEGKYKTRIPLEKVVESIGAKLDIYQKRDDGEKNTIRLTKLIEKAGIDVIQNRNTHVILIQDECIQKSHKRHKILIREVDRDKCINCGTCYRQLACPAISVKDEKSIIDPGLCLGCGICEEVCPAKAIGVKE